MSPEFIFPAYGRAAVFGVFGYHPEHGVVWSPAVSVHEATGVFSHSIHGVTESFRQVASPTGDWQPADPAQSFYPSAQAIEEARAECERRAAEAARASSPPAPAESSGDVVFTHNGRDFFRYECWSGVYVQGVASEDTQAAAMAAGFVCNQFRPDEFYVGPNECE